METGGRPLRHTEMGRPHPASAGRSARAMAYGWMVLGLLCLGVIEPVTSPARDVVPVGARQEKPPGQRFVDAAACPRDTTYDGLAPVESREIGAGKFPQISAGTWYWILYRHILSRPETRDTVRQDELVLRFRAAGTKAPVPVWHDRSSAEAGALLRPPRAARLGDALFLVHRRCERGTGGCMDWPFRLGNGTVDPLLRVYLDQLEARIPDEWGLWKGVYLNPADLTAEAPVYVPADPNCCASFRAEARVSVRGDALHLDSVRIMPDEDSPAWLIDPAEGIGHIRARTSAAALARAYGATAVRPASISIGQGLCVAGARVFPDTPMEIEVAWVDSAGSRPAFARVTRPGAPWRTPAGVGTGTSLARLEEIRGGPVVFSGFGWDGGGGLSWSEGRGELRLILALDREALAVLESDPRADELYGDRDVSSSHPLVPNLGVTVATIAIGWATLEPGQIRVCG